MPDSPTPFSVTSDRQALALSAAKPKDTFTLKIRNEGISADTVNLGIEPGLGAAGQPSPTPHAVDQQWFTVDGAPLPVQRQLPPSTDVLVTITVTMPDGEIVGVRRAYPFVPYVWSAVRPPRETTVYGPPSTLTVEGAKEASWLRRYWWVLAIAGLVLVVAAVLGFVLLTDDGPGNSGPSAQFVITPESPYEGDVVTMDLSESSDDSGTFSATVDWGDGKIVNLKSGVTTASHQYAAWGKFTVRLNLTDAEGLSGSASTTLTVYPIIT